MKLFWILCTHFVAVLQWFHDVFSPDISNKCEDALSMFSETHGFKVSLNMFLYKYF